MSWAAVVVGGATLVGSYMAADAAGDAADQQQAGAREANELQRQQFEQTRADAMPWQSSGVDALNMLRQRMGLPPVVNANPGGVPAAGSPGGAPAPAAAPQFTRDQLRSQLLPQFTSGGGQVYQMGTGDVPGGFVDQPAQINEAALNAEIERRMQAQAQQTPTTAGQQVVGEGARFNQQLPTVGGQPAQQAGQGDQTLGFRAPADRLTQTQAPIETRQRVTEVQARPESNEILMQQDPGYQFRLKQGQEALERSAAARGGLLSGRAARDTADYSQGLASQEFGNSWNRLMQLQGREYDQGMQLDARDFDRAMTNADRQWQQASQLDNRDYSRAWDQDQSAWNRLAGLAGVGQSSQQNTAALGSQYAGRAGDNITSGAAAGAAGRIGQANAYSAGLSQGVNQYNTNRLYDLYAQRSPRTGGASTGWGDTYSWGRE